MHKPKLLGASLFIFLLLSPISFATLTAPHQAKLDALFQAGSHTAAIESMEAQTQAIKKFSNLIRSKVFTFGLGSDLRLWVQVMAHIAEHFDAPIQKPKQEKGESHDDFNKRMAQSTQAEELKQNLLTYFKRKFQVQPDSNCVPDVSGVSGGVLGPSATSTLADVSHVADVMAIDAPEVVGKGPRITAGMLYVDLIGETQHEGWTLLNLEKVQAIRGATGYTAPRQEIRGQPIAPDFVVGRTTSAASQTMVALSDPVLSQLPLFQVNDEPVTLTQDKSSQAFFSELPKDVREKQADGSWVGYRYVFFRDALINTERYADPESREPLSLYVMKKVSPDTAKKYLIQEGQQEGFEEALEKAMGDHDLLHAALTLKNNMASEPQIRKRNTERARHLLTLLADPRQGVGLARAQHELALMYRDGIGGKRDLEKASFYAALAVSQGLPEISFGGVAEPGAAVANATGGIVQPHQAGLVGQVAVQGSAPGNAQQNVMDRFRSQFVVIPAGFLPGQIPVASFQADKFQATRELWQEIMGGKPADFPANGQPPWDQCLRCPVTHVNWENANGSRAEVQVFLEKLNQIEFASGCTYDLPTDHQNWYTIRADQTGLNQDPYSKGVTAANVDQYVTHFGNSDPGRTGRKTIQPVGNKTPNAFGVELGNAWRMSKERYDEAHPNYGRSVRGGSWGSGVGAAKSVIRNYADAGFRRGGMGFSLVRTCR